MGGDNQGRRKYMLATEVGCFHAEVMSLKAAIEEAIIKGQRSVTFLDDVPEFDPVSDDELEVASGSVCCGAVGWVDDF